MKEDFKKNEQKGENITRNRTTIIIGCVVVVVLITVIAVILLITKGKRQEEICNNEPVTEKAQEILVESVEKEVEKFVKESTDEIVEYETPEEWVDSLKLEEPTILIWNSETKENKILEDNEEYQLKKNDKVLLTTSNKFSDFKCTPGNIFEGFETVKRKYMEVFLTVDGKKEVTLELEIAGKKYSNTVVLIGTSGEIIESTDVKNVILAKEEIDINSELLGEEWITSIGNDIEEPFIAIWNDIEGSKKILGDGEKHQLRDNDVFFLYLPKYYYNEYRTPVGIASESIELENGRIYVIDTNKIKGETVVTFGVKKTGVKVVEVSCILTK